MLFSEKHGYGLVLDLFLRKEYRAGEKLFIHYDGDKIPLTIPGQAMWIFKLRCWSPCWARKPPGARILPAGSACTSALLSTARKTEPGSRALARPVTRFAPRAATGPLRAR